MRKLVIIILAFTVFGAMYLYQTNFFAIDSCLDQGGCWRYQTKQCEFEDQLKCDQELPVNK
jgi:hypothetical protein